MQVTDNRVELITSDGHMGVPVYSRSLRIGKNFGVVLPGGCDQKRETNRREYWITSTSRPCLELWV